MSIRSRDVRPSPLRAWHRDPVLVTDAAARSLQPAVAIVCSDRRVREGLASLVIASGGTVAGTACEAAEAVSLATVAQPGVILVDPQVDGIAGASGLLAALRATAPAARLLVLTWDGDPGRWLQAGVADAIVRVDAEPAAIVCAIAPGGGGLA